MSDIPADKPTTMPTLLTPKQVAEIFNRKERTIRNWVRAGYLHPVRIGRAVFFRAEDIAALLDAGGPPRS